MFFYDRAKEFEQDIITWRRDLHQIPEIGINLPKTVAYVSARLDEMGVEHQVFEDISCIVATIGAGEKCILLRGDMDALEIKEETGLDFACDSGRMHGCGHDLHAANLLGAARLLKEKEAELPGTVKLLFQSGEEIFKGSAAAIEAGVLENPKVDVAFGMHVFDMFPYNQILWGKLGFGAVYGFKITVNGKGGHGSQPERCIDPIHAAVQAYVALEGLLARECSPVEEAALTIGQFTAGNAANAIPDKAILQGTLRTFKPEVRAFLIKRINEIVPAVCEAYRCTAEIEVLSDVPSVICDEEFSNECMDIMRNNGITNDIKTDLHLIGSEDFANISDRVPSCYFVLGCGSEDPAKRLSQHNPKIIFDESIMARGAAIYASIAYDWLNNHK